MRVNLKSSLLMCSPTIDGSCIVMVRMSVCWFPISYYVVKRFFHKLNRVKHKLYHLFKNLNFHLHLIDGLSDTAKSVCEQEFNNIARVFGHLGTPNLTFEESHKAKVEEDGRYCFDHNSPVFNLSVFAMDLSSPKVGSDEKLALCKKYFYIGFAFLPLLWAVNAVWFVK